MAVNKVIYKKHNGTVTLIDLTDSTVTPETLAAGKIAYNSKGERIVGTAKIAIVNQIPISTDASGNLFVGTNGEKGYKANTRLSGSSGAEATSSATGLYVTGFIPVKHGDTVYFKGVTITNAVSPAAAYIWLYNKDKTKMFANETHAVFGMTNGEVISNVLTAATFGYGIFTPDAGVCYMRIVAHGIDSNSIITVNQPIE